MLKVTSDRVTQSIYGITRIELGGKQAGTGYDQLVVTGTVTLEGTLDVTIIGGFTPALGDEFAVLTYGDRQNQFDVIDGTDLGGGLSLVEEYQAAQLVLKVE